MTTNVALVTDDAIVLGCDSIASMSGVYLDPFSIEWEKDSDGKIVRDEKGKFSLRFDRSNFQNLVTDTWGGVTKLFQIHPDPSPFAAVTSGLAKLNDRPIASLAGEFYRKRKNAKGRKAALPTTIAHEFLTFIRTHYDEHYKDSEFPEDYREGPEFLLGGYGKEDESPSLFRIDVKGNKVVEVNSPRTKSHTGLSWNAQSDAVERFIRGCDTSLTNDISRTIERQLKEHSRSVNEYVTTTVNSILEKLNQQLPDGIEIKPPELSEIELNWKRHKLNISYANMPLQEAINFVGFLVHLESGRSRFDSGVGTVGGRTHIGVITKDSGFRVLNEPDLVHRHTGFGDDH